jgi:DNA repair protein RadC
MSIHSGHRQRMKERFLKEGLDSFSEVQVLEMLLFYCIPRQDTNPLAHMLLERFGSLAAVLEASPDELRKVPGIGESAAIFLPLVLETGRYYMISRQENQVILTNVEQCGRYMIPYFHGRRNETVFLLCLDAKCKVICCKEVGEGSVNSASVPIRRIVEMALGANATSVVLAHNHPSGIAVPSGDDVQTTRRLAMALSAVEIQLVDHIVVADEDFVSMAQSGCFRHSDSKLPL